MRVKSICLGILCATAATFWLAPAALGCGPFSPTAVFTYWAHPELPLGAYAAGELGVVEQRYARSYLTVAYRVLSGKPLTAEEQEAAVDLWTERLAGGWNYGEDAWLAAWAEARKQVPAAGEAPDVRVARSMNGDTYYFDYLNCPEDAFRTATAALAERVQKLGAQSPEVLAWVQAQDQVFASCAEPQAPPATLPPGSLPQQQADRAYQIAAAQFYAGDFEAAEKGFAAIAQDSGSPWKRLAPYLLARTLVRRASVGPEALADGAADKIAPLLQRAEEELGKVLADPAAKELQPAARRMLGLVRLRAHGQERRVELAKALLEPDQDGSYYQDLWDFTTLLDHVAPVEGYSAEAPAFEALAAVPREDDLSDWVLTFQSAGPGAWEHSLERWKSLQSVPWLLAALAHADANSPELPRVLEAAAKLEPSGPGFTTATYHRNRLLVDAAQAETARAGLDAILGSAKLPVGARNLLLAQRLRIARSLEELLRDAQRVPVVISYEDGPKEEPLEEDSLKYITEDESIAKGGVDRLRLKSPALDVDGVNALEALPLGLQIKAANSTVLPQHLQRELVLGAWTRAVLLGQDAAATELTPLLQGLVPELQADLEAYRSAADPAARHFSAVLLMLRFPGSSFHIGAGIGRLTRIDKIDSFRDNWWCAAPGLPESLPPFLDAGQQAAAREERQKLIALGTGADWLAQQALDRAAAAPEDPGVPEALHLAVRATRYGCTDEATGKLSKAAFNWLHKKYPASPWTKQTPHWFN